MDSLICLSQYFVNKLNVRSFSNILKTTLKKSDVSNFASYILEINKDLVSEIPQDILNILDTLRTNLWNKSKDDFKNYFRDIPKEKDYLYCLNKEDIFLCCWVALCDIIPKSFFGGNQNNNIFKRFVHTVVYSVKRQHIFITKVTEKWDFSVPPWTGRKVSKIFLCKILIWIIRYILSAMICLNFYVTTCKLDANENKLYYFWKSQWQSFYDKKISNMVNSKVIKRFDPYCLGKKPKRCCDFSERMKLKLLRKDIPKLHLILKPNNDCRPIVHYKSGQQTKSEKYKVKDKLHFLRSLTCNTHKRIEIQFNKVYHEWIEFNQPKLYFVKTDLSNAFGLINKEKLMKILCERHLHYQKTEKCLYSKKKFAQHYKEMLGELRRPLLVRAGNTVYEWREGLVQGYKYSPALSELYYSYLDDLYFSEHLKKSGAKIRLFIRVVDDYLYITDSLDDAHLFLNALFSYRNVNYEKTFVNFSHENIKCTDEITFLGYSYNTNLLQVSRASNVCTGQMCYKIAFSSGLADITKFLEKRIGQSGIQINGHIFNLYYNTEEIIWQHIFTTFCLSANKFCTILAVSELCSQTAKTEMQNYVSLYKKRVSVKLSNSIVEMLMKNKPPDFLFMYCINHFKFLSFKALYLCATQTSKCSGLVPFIKDEMAKSNCIFGKWKNHACRIETNGEMRRQAIREVCRRTDLRKFMKNFDTLPSGYDCYNERKLR